MNLTTKKNIMSLPKKKPKNVSAPTPPDLLLTSPLNLSSMEIREYSTNLEMIGRIRETMVRGPQSTKFALASKSKRKYSCKSLLAWTQIVKNLKKLTRPCVRHGMFTSTRLLKLTTTFLCQWKFSATQPPKPQNYYSTYIQLIHGYFQS